MRLLILSDLHREVWYRVQSWYDRKPDPFPIIDLDISAPEVVVLAGDIDVPARAIAWASERFAPLPVLYVPGNHEAYGGRIDQVQEEMEATCCATGHVHYLQQRDLVIGGVRFLGATLWSDFMLYGADRRDAAIQSALKSMNDYRRIQTPAGVTATPQDTQAWHAADVAWLESRLARPFGGRTVVVTHMGPSFRSIGVQYRNDLLSAAFASHLDHLVERADVWIHGHTHVSADYRVGESRVICNPLGYPSRYDMTTPENPDFDPNRIVEV